MARLGSLEEWLAATARAGASAVSFSSCYPFQGDVEFVAPPRTLWPPASPALMAARVRWKSARFIPVEVVGALAANARLDENRWSVDGASECLVPAGRPGPFRTGVRWNAAVDRLSGASERHSTACLEFHSGAGLWTVVSFADDAARDSWMEPVKACFRLLADSGFGGERSRGWGRSEPPEFTEGTLPDLVLAMAARYRRKAGKREAAEIRAPQAAAPLTQPEAAPAPAGGEPEIEAPAEPAIAEAVPPAAELPEAPEPSIAESTAETETRDSAQPESEAPPVPAEAAPESAAPPEAMESAEIQPAPAESPESEQPEAEDTATEPVETAEPVVAETPRPAAAGPGAEPHWLLSLFLPAPEDAVAWGHGSYALVERSGRVESLAGSGELKKVVRMVAEGSVVCAPAPPRGAAADVAPEGFPHPVFRAGFAVAIPLSEVSRCATD
jgi:hypothetical protein